MRRRLLVGIAFIGAVVAGLFFALRPSPDPETVHVYVYTEPPAGSVPRESPPLAAEPPSELELAANRGDVAARARLCSEAVESGERYGGDYRDAADWCFLAAQDGDARSQAHYARLFQLGAGVAQDEAEAVAWYEKAVARQDAYAMYMRGRMLIASSDPVDNARGQALLERAAALGDTNARWALQESGNPPDGNQRRPQTLIR
jgi:TPR repeat protein